MSAIKQKENDPAPNCTGVVGNIRSLTFLIWRSRFHAECDTYYVSNTKLVDGSPQTKEVFMKRDETGIATITVGSAVWKDGRPQAIHAGTDNYANLNNWPEV